MVTDFIIVRHGETEYNREKILQGWMDVPLNETGRRQARQAAETLRNETFDEVWMSDLIRTRETAEYILGYHPGVPVHISPELREWKLGILQGKKLEELQRSMPEMADMLACEEADPEVPGGERRSEFRKRVERIFRDIAACSPGKRVLVVTHGGVLSRLFCLLRPDLSGTRIPENASITGIRYDHETGIWDFAEGAAFFPGEDGSALRTL